MSGKAVKKNKQRDQYTLLSYSTAKKTARRIDQQLKLVRSPKPYIFTLSYSSSTAWPQQ